MVFWEESFLRTLLYLNPVNLLLNKYIRVTQNYDYVSKTLLKITRTSTFGTPGFSIHKFCQHLFAFLLTSPHTHKLILYFAIKITQHERESIRIYIRDFS